MRTWVQHSMPTPVSLTASMTIGPGAPTGVRARTPGDSTFCVLMVNLRHWASLPRAFTAIHHTCLQLAVIHRHFPEIHSRTVLNATSSRATDAASCPSGDHFVRIQDPGAMTPAAC